MNGSHTGGDVDLRYDGGNDRGKVEQALDRLMEEHERGNSAKLEVWVQNGSYKVVGRKTWDWREDET